MTRGKGEQTKVIYKGKNEDFIVFVESVGNLIKWRSDPSIPLVDVVDSFKVFCTHKYDLPSSPSIPGTMLTNLIGTEYKESSTRLEAAF